MDLLSVEESHYLTRLMDDNEVIKRKGSLLHSKSLKLFYASGCATLAQKQGDDLKSYWINSQTALKILSAPDCEIVHTEVSYATPAAARLAAMALASQIKKTQWRD